MSVRAGAGHDEVDFPAAALAADEPLVPVRDAEISAVALGHRSGIGLDLVAAIAAPHDEPRMGRGGAAECRRPHRRETASWEHVNKEPPTKAPKEA